MYAKARSPPRWTLGETYARSTKEGVQNDQACKLEMDWVYVKRDVNLTCNYVADTSVCAAVVVVVV